jgi:hypothetical protein
MLPGPVVPLDGDSLMVLQSHFSMTSPVPSETQDKRYSKRLFGHDY